MRKLNKIISIVVLAALFSSCAKPILKSVAYKKLYSESPKTILIMPPINKSTNVEAKEYFHSTLSVPLVNKGYYVIPPFLSMEILKKESAYNSELFINSPLKQFGDIFGADAVLFTIIHKWSKNALLANVTIEVEYILKSTKTNEVLYTRRGTVQYSASSNSNNMLVNMATSAIKTAATDYTMVARKCNIFTFSDIPAGKYSPKYKVDEKENAGSKTFKANIN
ncbi:MAG: GNA1162 family protein [Bacteroidota bacterium]